MEEKKCRGVKLNAGRSWGLIDAWVLSRLGVPFARYMGPKVPILDALQVP